jgi:hypothetical protein
VSRRGGRILAVACAVAIAVATAVGPAGAAASTTPASEPEPYLALRDVSPWVTADGTWRADWDITAEPPPGASLRYTIHEAINGASARERLDDVLDGGSLGAGLQSAVDVPMVLARSGSSVTLQIPVRSRSDGSARTFLPNPGIHPVEISLVALDGSELQHIVLFLTHLPAEVSAPPLRVAPVLSVLAPPLVSPDGTVAIPDGTEAGISQAAELLDAAGDLPVTVHLDPLIVSATRDSHDPIAGSHLTGLLSAIGPRPVLRSPWVPVDLESWAASGAVTSFQSSLLAGQTTLAGALDRAPDGDVWPPDPTLGPRSVGWLRSAGVRHVVLDADQVTSAKELDDDPGTTQRFRVDSADSGLDALLLDPVLAGRLAAAAPPELAAHRAATELEAMWFATPRGATPAAVVDLTSVPSAASRAFLADLAQANATLRPATLADAFADATAYGTTTRRRTEPLVRKVVAPQRLRDEGAISREVARLRTRAASYHSSISEGGDRASLEQVLLTVQHRDLGLAGQLAYLAAAAHRIDAGLAFVVPPESRSFTITARRSELPIRITNNATRKVTVLLRFKGTRLQVNGGRALTAVLKPGANSLTVPVLARTSGEFTMVVEIRTADGALLLSSTDLRIRSTVVSGVGVVLATGALTFLVVWWALTIRRERRRRRDAPPDDADAAAAPPDPRAPSLA